MGAPAVILKHKPEVGDEPLLTLAAVRALKADYEADVRLLEELPGRVELKKRRLEAAMMFLPPGVDLDQVAAAAPPKPPAPITRSPAAAWPFPTGSVAPVPPTAPAATGATADEKITWSGEMTRLLVTSGRGLSHRELLDELKKTELGERSSPGEKSFYNTISRLAERGVLVKAGGLLYHADVAERLRASGNPLPDMTTEVGRRAGGSSSLVVDALTAHSKGLTAPELKRVIGARDDAPKSLKDHGQYIYNVLSTMLGNGTITRRNGVYRLAKRQERSAA